MANILEFVRAILIDPGAQQRLETGAEAYVTEAGFGDLTGEDVVEAILVLRRSLVPELAAALADFEDEGRIPRVRPARDERELDAALRQLRHAVAVVGPKVPSEPAAETPVEHHEPIEVDAEPELIEPAPEIEPEPVAPPLPSSPPPGHLEVSGLPSVELLTAAISAAAVDLHALLGDYVSDVRERLSATLAQAERDAAAVRAAADADRQTAHKVLLDARDEADRIVAEVERGRAELEARRDELREAEREMKERVAGLDTVFRNVLKDD